MSLVLQRFYETLTAVSCSAVTGEGIDAVVEALRGTRREYESEYRAALLERMQQKAKASSDGTARLEKDLNDDEEKDEHWSEDE